MSGHVSQKVKRPYEKLCYNGAYESIEKYITVLFFYKNMMLQHGMTRECLIGDGDDYIAKSLLHNKAMYMYHKICRDNVRPHIRERTLVKRAHDEMEASGFKISPKKTRKSFGGPAIVGGVPVCLLLHVAGR